MNERKNIPKAEGSLSPIGKAMLEAAQRAQEQNPDMASDLIHGIRLTAEDLLGRMRNVAEKSNVIFEQLGSDARIPLEPETQPGSAAENSLDPTILYMDSARRPAVRREQEPEISERQAQNPQRKARLQARMSLREFTASLRAEQKLADAMTDVEEAMTGVEQNLQTLEEIVQTGQVIEAKPEPAAVSTKGAEAKGKEERRKIAEAQRAANRAEKRVQREIREKQLTEETKQECVAIGRDYFNLTFHRKDAERAGVKPEELYDRFWGLASQFNTYSPDRQAEIIKQIALGMQISKTSISPLYKKLYGSANSHNESLDDVDYLIHSFTLLLGYFTDERLSFIEFIRSEARGKRIDLPLVYRATARWLTRLTE